MKILWSIVVNLFLVAGAFAADKNSGDVVDQAISRANTSLSGLVDNRFIEDAVKKAEKSKEYFDENSSQQTIEMIGGSKSDENQLLNKNKIKVKIKYFLFVSSSVPLDTMREYARQCDTLLNRDKIGVSMVLRGFKDGMHKMRPTADWIKSVLVPDPGETPDAEMSQDQLLMVDVMIDPELEGKYQIREVPALVSAGAGEGTPCVVYGDVQVRSLMEHLEKGQCGKIGATYQFAERNAMEEIEERSAKVDWVAAERDLAQKLKGQYENLPGSGMLPAAVKDERWQVAKPYTLPFDVPNPQSPGEILYPKGYTYNPMEFITVPFSVALLDGTRKEQLDWLKTKLDLNQDVTPLTMITMLGGNYSLASEALKKKVYSGAKIARAGWCTATPCIVSFEPGKPWLDVAQFHVKVQSDDFSESKR